MDEIKQIGQNIRKYRKKQGLTQLDLAVECGFEEPSVWRLENGKTNPTIKTLLKITKALDIKLTDLVKIK
ncbi:MAG: helix-turn-helix domain-containing protein [Bacteroidota bacterium]